MQPTRRNASIDSLRRNPTDGAYHCPRCDAPFTRRSNLRRHYHIHTRNSMYKCQSCSESFTQKEELESHLLRCTSTSSTWCHVPTNQIVESIGQYAPSHDINQTMGFVRDFELTPSGSNPHTPSGISSDFSHLDIFQRQIPLKTDEQAVQDFQDMFSIPSSFSEGTSSPSSSEALSPSNIAFPFFPTPPSSSSTTSPSLMNITPGYLPDAEERNSTIANCDTYNAPEKNDLNHKQLYTRKQVEDMLEIVTSCFLATIDAVLQREPSLASSESELQPIYSHAGLESGRIILSDTIPRLIASLTDGSCISNHTLP